MCNSEKGTAMAEILKRVGLVYPQEVFCAMRVELGPDRVGRFIEQYTERRQLLSSLSSDVAAPSTVAVVVDVDDGSEDGTKRQRLFGVLDAILRRHLTQICALNQMMDELDNFSIGPAEATLNRFRQILSDCHFDQFTKIGELTTTPADAQLLKGLIEWLQSPQIVKAAAEGDTNGGKLFNELLGDFHFCTAFSSQQNAAASGVPLHRVASALRKWVIRICAHLRSTLGKSAKRLADSSTFLAQFNAKMAQINIFDGHLNMGTSPQFNTQIAQFVPLFDEIVRADSVFRLFRVRALNGKIYSYQLERVRYDHSRGHIFQLFCLLNAEFAKRRDTARRFVQFALPHILYTGANCRLLRCCPLAGLSSRHQNANADHSAQNFAVFTDIMSEMLNNNNGGNNGGGGTDCADEENGTLALSPLAVIDQYYGRLAEQRYSHKTIHELFNQICGMKSEVGTGGGDQHHHPSSTSSLITVPKDLLSRWMGQKYGDAATIWMARKKLAVQIALLGLSEHALFLSSMRPDGLFLDLSTGQLFFTDYKFDLTKKVCETITGKVPFIELDANRPVPFRLTPNISHFLGLSIDGHLIGALTAVARSLNALSLENSVWLDLFNWRLQFFSSLLRFYDNSEQQQQQQQSLAAAASSPPASTTLSVPLHAITQCHLQQARAFRHSNQLDMAQSELNKLNSALLVHPMDAQQKLDEHVKCLLKLASGDVSSTAKKVKAQQDAILEALETIEGTPFNFLKRDQIARLMTNKGILLSRMDKREEAGRAFSAAAQLEQLGETAIPSSFASVWKHWATFLGNLYLTNHTESSALNTGIQAIACTLDHIWMVGAQKSRTSVAKLFWLLKIASSCPSEKLMNSVDEKLLRYVDTIHPTNWLFWLHEIVADVQQRKGTAMAEILKRVGLVYPQEVFCAMRVELGPDRVGRFIEQYTERRQLLSSLSSDVAAPSTVAVVVDVDDGSEDGTKRQRLFGVLDAILRRHLTQICALNQMMDELDNFSIGPAEATLNRFRQILSDCHFDQFTKIGELTTTPADAQLLKGLIEWLQSPQIVKAAAEGDTNGGKLFNELLGDFHFCTAFSSQQNAAASGVPLHRVASALRKWVIRICAHLRSTLGKSAKRLADSSTFLAQFNAKMAQINIFDGHLNMGTSPQFNTQIAQFVPLFDEIVRADSVFRLFRVRALNGKIYSYQLERVRYDHSRGHIFQLFCLLNAEFAKRRDTARRFVQFALPHILYTGANCRLLRCCPLAGLSSRHQNANADHSAQNFAVFTDIMSEMLNNNNGGNNGGGGTDCANEENGTLALSPLAVIDQYYGRLAEQRYSHKTIHELFNQICGMKSEVGTGGGDQHHHPSSTSSLITVPKDLLSRWMGQKYGDAATIWMARKKLAVQIALLGLSEHALFLSSMRPDGLFLDLSTGQLFFTDYKFDLTKKVCETITGKVPFIELDANRPVPFRLTPNISHFLGLSIDGHLIGALTAVARSLNALSLEVWLRPILWDVFAKAAEDDPQLNIVNPVKRAVDTIVGRVKTLSQFDVGMGSSSQQQLLVQHSMLYDNLCRMDPSWHPWF
uniref:FATC domain-containing protein n=1 Tax=Globodera pallida TaxID=36090 RepID=A0A183C2W8_GLOPA